MEAWKPGEALPNDLKLRTNSTLNAHLVMAYLPAQALEVLFQSARQCTLILSSRLLLVAIVNSSRWHADRNPLVMSNMHVASVMEGLV